MFVVALIGLGFVGWKSALKITGGRVSEVTDPAAPNFIAKVEPTNVDLVAVTAADGSLLTALFLLSDPAGKQKSADAAANTGFAKVAMYIQAPALLVLLITGILY